MTACYLAVQLVVWLGYMLEFLMADWMVQLLAPQMVDTRVDLWVGQLVGRLGVMSALLSVVR